MSKDKDTLRAQKLAERRSLTSAGRDAASATVVSVLVKTRLFTNATTVATYLALKKEVCLSALLALQTPNEKRFAAPRTRPDNRLSFHEITQNSTTERGSGGVMQPTADAAEIFAQTCDLFLVPLIACDRRGNRLGFGQGYYDRALAGQSGFKLGVGFEFQLVDALDSEPHDVPLDGFVSERGLHVF